MKAIAYVDGSYSENKKGEGVYGSGVFLILEGMDMPMEFSFGGAEKEFLVHHNAAGEVMACTELITFLETNYPQVNQLDLYYDYKGIECWVTGEWNAYKALSIAYREIMREAQKRMRIRFFHVDSHSGNIYNDRADSLAKRGVADTAAELGIVL